MWLCKLIGHKFKISWADVETRLNYCSRCGFRPEALAAISPLKSTEPPVSTDATLGNCLDCGAKDGETRENQRVCPVCRDSAPYLEDSTGVVLERPNCQGSGYPPEALTNGNTSGGDKGSDANLNKKED